MKDTSKAYFTARLNRIIPHLLTAILVLLSPHLLCAASDLCCADSIVCGEPRPVTSTYSFEIGGTDVLSTYLSPLHYTGTFYGASGEWSKAMPFNPENMIMTFEGGGRFRNMLNPAATASMMGLHAYFNWSLSYRWRLPHKFMLAAGGGFDLRGGALYLMRNGNNPVAADASAALTATARVSRHFSIGRLPVLVSDRVQMPLLGAFFSPQYGETYYEIYLGNHSGLVHCGYPGNRFCIDNLLSFDLDFGRTAMRIGYRYSCESSWVCNLNTQIQTHSFVIGVIPGGLGLKKKTKNNYALYY